MKQDRMERLVKKTVVLYTRSKFRFQGVVQGYDGKFIEIFDAVKKEPKLLSVDEIIEVEVKE